MNNLAEPVRHRDEQPVAEGGETPRPRGGALPPGTRVTVLSPDFARGWTGTVVEGNPKLLNGHDCFVQVEDRPGFPAEWGPLCFYLHELAVQT